MPSNRLHLGAYWSARRESVDQCAERLEPFLRGIARCDRAFSTWCEKGRSRRDALRRTIDITDRERLVKLLNQGRNRSDTDRKVIEDLGFMIDIWNGQDDENELSLSVSCGLYCVSPNPKFQLYNVVSLDFPHRAEIAAHPEMIREVLTLTATCWEPDWAGVYSLEAGDRHHGRHKPLVDWMVYVSHGIAAVPPPSELTRLENGGSLIVVQPQPPSLDNPEDQQRIRQIEALVWR